MGQMESLIRDVSRQVAETATKVDVYLRRVEKLEGELRRLEIEFTKVKQDAKWTGEERRKVDGRLQTGDHTFQRMQTEIADAQQIAEAAHGMAKAALAAAEAARNLNAERPTGIRKKIKKHLVEALVPMAIGVVWWALYHLLLIGPEIAKLMKATKGGHP